MKQTLSPPRKLGITSVALLAIALPSICQAEDQNSSASRDIKEFLSDPHRAGSLAGIVMGGALTAHPVGAAAGSIIGYIIGKKIIGEKEQPQSYASYYDYSKRSIVPDADSQAQVLALNTSQEELAEEQIVLPYGATEEVEINQASSFDVEYEAPSTSATPAEKIAAYCYSDHGLQPKFNPQLQEMCYYHQSSS